MTELTRTLHMKWRGSHPTLPSRVIGPELTIWEKVAETLCAEPTLTLSRKIHPSWSPVNLRKLKLLSVPMWLRPEGSYGSPGLRACIGYNPMASQG